MFARSARLAVFAAVAAFFLLPAPSLAQEEAPQPEKYENAGWYVVSMTAFKAGKAEEANRFIEDNFIPVDKAIGRDVIPFRPMTGKWDHIVYFPIEGPGELSWRRSPTSIEWWQEFVRQQGGEEEAEKAMDQFDKFVAHSETHLVQRQYDASEQQ